MADIKQGQLVRIVKFHRVDAVFGSELENKLLGKTGKFIVRESRPKSKFKSYVRGTYGGEFEFVPDFDENRKQPCFHAVYVEPLDEP